MGIMNIRRFLAAFVLVFFTIVAQGQSDEVSTLVLDGIDLHDSGKYDEALALYRKALEIEPNSSMVMYEMALSYMSLDNYDEAIKLCKKVIKMDDGNLLEAYIAYGNALDMQGKSKKSIKVYEKAMKEFDYYLLSYNHAISCYYSGKTKKALASTLQAINLDLSHASSHLLLSMIMRDEGSRIKAILPLYIFLLLEPESERAAGEYEVLRNYLNGGVEWNSDTNVTISISMDEDPEFGAAEMMVSLLAVSGSFEENIGKNDLEMFAKNTEDIFFMLGEMIDASKSGIWWETYIPFYLDVAENGFAEVYSYYISQSLGDEVRIWLDEHEDVYNKFANWMNE